MPAKRRSARASERLFAGWRRTGRKSLLRLSNAAGGDAQVRQQQAAMAGRKCLPVWLSLHELLFRRHGMISRCHGRECVCRRCREMFTDFG
jgi:hypothetical protein